MERHLTPENQNPLCPNFLFFCYYLLEIIFILFVSFVLIIVKQDEWTGEQKIQFGDVAEDIEPEEIRPMGNYAVSITWPDGFSQV